MIYGYTPGRIYLRIPRSNLNIIGMRSRVDRFVLLLDMAIIWVDARLNLSRTGINLSQDDDDLRSFGHTEKVFLNEQERSLFSLSNKTERYIHFN